MHPLVVRFPKKPHRYREPFLPYYTHGRCRARKILHAREIGHFTCTNLIAVCHGRFPDESHRFPDDADGVGKAESHLTLSSMLGSRAWLAYSSHVTRWHGRCRDHTLVGTLDESTAVSSVPQPLDQFFYHSVLCGYLFVTGKWDFLLETVVCRRKWEIKSSQEGAVRRNLFPERTPHHPSVLIMRVPHTHTRVNFPWNHLYLLGRSSLQHATRQRFRPSGKRCIVIGVQLIYRLMQVDEQFRDFTYSLRRLCSSRGNADIIGFSSEIDAGYSRRLN